ncbi:hypothetical protein Leryth_010668 [Lithospermum erythrorhizon]|nr:hypothetical protein Leryth_010668 [Lithospermum erythrorhizon]
MGISCMSLFYQIARSDFYSYQPPELQSPAISFAASKRTKPLSLYKPHLSHKNIIHNVWCLYEIDILLVLGTTKFSGDPGSEALELIAGDGGDITLLQNETNPPNNLRIPPPLLLRVSKATLLGKALLPLPINRPMA